MIVARSEYFSRIKWCVLLCFRNVRLPLSMFCNSCTSFIFLRVYWNIYVHLRFTRWQFTLLAVQFKHTVYRLCWCTFVFSGCCKNPTLLIIIHNPRYTFTGMTLFVFNSQSHFFCCSRAIGISRYIFMVDHPLVMSPVLVSKPLIITVDFITHTNIENTNVGHIHSILWILFFSLNIHCHSLSFNICRSSHHSMRFYILLCAPFDRIEW